MSVPPDNPFWDFSVAVYGQPGVAEACLHLQDTAGVDVNVLLYCCWLARRRPEALTEAEISAIAARTEVWRNEVVRPLRSVRRWLKGGRTGLPAESVESLRSAVKKIELQSERLQQDMLFKMARETPGNAAGTAAVERRAAQNIDLYLKVIGAPRPPPVAEACRAVATAAAAEGR